VSGAAIEQSLQVKLRAHFSRAGNARNGAYELWLDRAIEKCKTCDVVLYQTGADPHINDPLGAPRVRIVVASLFQRMIRPRAIKTNAKNKTFTGLQRAGAEQSQSARLAHTGRCSSRIEHVLSTLKGWLKTSRSAGTVIGMPEQLPQGRSS
jgi:hypothetical protein